MTTKSFLGSVVGMAVALLAFEGATPSASVAQTVPVVRATVGKGFDEAYGVGVGASAGIEFPFIRNKPFFVGLRSAYYFGSDGTLGGLGADGSEDPTGRVSQFQAGIEIGSTWMSSPLLIRTVGGVGLARVSLELDSGRSHLEEGASNKLQYGPGLLVALPRAHGSFVGMEIKWLKVSDLDSALSVSATVGTRIF